MTSNSFPLAIKLEFLNANLGSVHIIDLGWSFLESAGISSAEAGRPLIVAIDRKTSIKDNYFYEYEQKDLPLPDGLNTYLRLEGVIIPMGRIRPSKKGNPTREGSAEIVVGGSVYKVTAYITEDSTPFFVKVIAHKKPGGQKAPIKTRSKIKGGRLI